jgi:hypothetical protein
LRPVAPEVVVGHPLDVGARHEDRRVGAGDDRRPHVGRQLDPGHESVDLGVELLVERVGRRLVQGADGDRPGGLDGEEGEGGETGIQTNGR